MALLHRYYLETSSREKVSLKLLEDSILQSHLVTQVPSLILRKGSVAMVLLAQPSMHSTRAHWIWIVPLITLKHNRIVRYPGVSPVASAFWETSTFLKLLAKLSQTESRITTCEVPAQNYRWLCLTIWVTRWTSKSCKTCRLAPNLRIWWATPI